MYVCVLCFACLFLYHFVIYLSSNFNKPRFLLFYVVLSTIFCFSFGFWAFVFSLSCFRSNLALN